MADPMKKTVYLSLGSNVGDRAKNLRDAIAALGSTGVSVVRVSSVYETEPVDYLDQRWFLNCAVEAETELAALDLLHALRGIEAQMGSTKLIDKGPRLIDIDILLWQRNHRHARTASPAPAHVPPPLRAGAASPNRFKCAASSFAPEHFGTARADAR